MTNLVQFPGLGLSFELSRVAFSIGGMHKEYNVRKGKNVRDISGRL